MPIPTIIQFKITKKVKKKYFYKKILRQMQKKCRFENKLVKPENWTGQEFTFCPLCPGCLPAGTFNNLSFESALGSMRDRKFPPKIVDWYKNFLYNHCCGQVKISKI
jgi:hypothetical protein